ncbi:hypothetical protein TNCV_2358521 [Trichonephila clavipes]|nr:hypothetical protein TNCV_2358521 [Trichonephila clavipes]
MGPGALELFYGSAGKDGENGSLRMHVSHLVEVGGDVMEVRNYAGPKLWLGLCKDGTFCSIFAVPLPRIRSNSWEAQLAIPSYPRYARSETNLGIG